MTLLFLVIPLLSGMAISFLQPLLGKMLLPVFGGTALTWNTILLMFSGAIFISAVYGVSFLSRFKQQTQLLIQLFIFGGCLVFVMTGMLPPQQSDTSLLVQLGVLSLTVLPFVLTGWGTVFALQKWHGFQGLLKTKPLILFAMLYLGSAVGVGIFHFCEASWGSHQLFKVFEVMIAGLGLLLVVAFFCVRRLDDNMPWLDKQKIDEGKKPWLNWVISPLITSALLVGYTHMLSAEFSASPVIWGIPLGIYGLSLFFAFIRPSLISVNFLFILMMLTAVPLMLIYLFGETIPTLASLSLQGVFYFSAVFLLHKFLSVFSSQTARGIFFICFTGGQLLGTAFITLSPLIFRDYSEYPVTMVMALGLSAFFWGKHLALNQTHTTRIKALLPFVLMFIVALIVAEERDELSAQKVIMLSSIMAVSLTVLMRTPFLLSAALLGIVVAPNFTQDDSIIYKTRSFYGLSQVQYWNEYKLYTNGSTIHGAEPLSEKRAVTYYTQEGPIGAFFNMLDNYLSQRPAAILGLGVGAVTSYMAADQIVDYFEIDPVVEDVARDHFSFLKDSPSQVKVILGDGRLEIEKQDQDKYGLIMLDAFSSDAIPTHLLTLEAFQIYTQKLKNDGVILINITNRHMDLYPSLYAMADILGFYGARGSSSQIDDEKLIFASDWVVFTRDAEKINMLTEESVWQKAEPPYTVQAVWKDDYVDLKSAFKKNK